MSDNTTLRLALYMSALLFTSIALSQVGINTTSPSKTLDVNIKDAASDGINIGSDTFDIELLSEPVAGAGTFAINNTALNGQTAIRFNSSTRFGFSNSALWPAVNATSPFVNGALDLGRFDRHYRRTYTRGVHTNDDAVNGGLGINIGSGGGSQSDYVFSDFALYPVVSQLKDLGRSGNFWRNFYFVSAFTPSDKRLKKNIKSISHGTEILKKMKMYEYNYIFEEEEKTHYGFMAQELQELLPELVAVGDDEARSLSINYTETIPIIIKTVQEQQVLIEKQAQELAELKKLVQRLIETQN